MKKYEKDWFFGPYNASMTVRRTGVHSTSPKSFALDAGTHLALYDLLLPGLLAQVGDLSRWVVGKWNEVNGRFSKTGIRQVRDSL
jgi:hypothetical protein